MTLLFRNIDLDPSTPIEQWPGEAIQTALERGGLSDWRPIVGAIQAQPWGRTARQVEEVLSHSRPYGVADVMELAIERARERAQAEERAVVAEEIAALLRESGLSRAAFAAGIGTSAPRLSTYLTGKVTPSAALLVRMRRLASPRRRS
jgi:DNA-binding transcriptional regulator YiaG